MFEMNYWMLSAIVLIAFLLGVAVCYVFSVSRMSRELSESYWYLLEVLKNTEDTKSNTNEILDDTKHIQDTLNSRHKQPTLEQVIGQLLLSEDWEIDTMFDDISGQTTAFVDETDLPADFAINVEFDETLTYTIVVPKRVLNALKRVLSAKTAQQEVSSLPYSSRQFLIETPVTAKPPNNNEPIIINPALTAAANQHMEKKT